MVILKVEDWNGIYCILEYESVNPITIKMLPRDCKIIYTYIKKNTPVKAVDLLRKFHRYDVDQILRDLRDMHLIYFDDEAIEDVRNK